MADAFLGEIRQFTGNFAPKYWMYCHGQLLKISDYTALFSILGDTYGGDGIKTFGLPDYKGRCNMGSGVMPGGIYKTMGMKAGNDLTYLTNAEMPPHAHPISDATVNHTLTASGGGEAKCQATHGNSVSPKGKTFAAANNRGGDTIYGDADDKLMKAGTLPVNLPVKGNITVSGHTSSVGSGGAFSNLPPYGVVDYIICIDGVYPQRSD